VPNTHTHFYPLCYMYVYLAVTIWFQLLFAVGLAARVAPAGMVGPEPSEVVGRRMPFKAPGRLRKRFEAGGGPRLVFGFPARSGAILGSL
jgi:hypothetical protein